MEDLVRAFGYIRVGAVPAATGVSGSAQRAVIAAEADRRGWRVQFVTDTGAAAGTLGRAGLNRALGRLDDGEADVLVVARLDRLARSVGDLGVLAERAREGGWTILSLDVGLDTSTPAGSFVASLVAGTARDDSLIGRRTREALAARKAAGVRLGRPAAVPADVVARVVAERQAGRSLVAIARGLDQDGVPTARGGLHWYPTTVAKLLQSQQASDLRGGAGSA